MFPAYDVAMCSDNHAKVCRAHLAALISPAYDVAICIKAKYAEACHTHTHLAAPISPAYNVSPISPAYNMAIYIKAKYAEACHTHLAAPISPAAWRHLSPGDILFAASGVAGSWPDSERTLPPELLVCSLLPTPLWHVSSKTSPQCRNAFLLSPDVSEVRIPV